MTARTEHQQIILSAAPIKVSADIYYYDDGGGWWYTISFPDHGVVLDENGPFYDDEEAFDGALAEDRPSQLAELAKIDAERAASPPVPMT